MAENRKNGLLWAGLVILILFLVWLGGHLGWWSFGNDKTGTNTVNNFYSDVRNDRSRDEVTSASQENGVSPSCTVTVNTTQLKREVCVYTSSTGTGSVTVTYENGKVTSVSKSGF